MEADEDWHGRFEHVQTVARETVDDGERPVQRFDERVEEGTRFRREYTAEVRCLMFCEIKMGLISFITQVKIKMISSGLNRSRTVSKQFKPSRAHKPMFGRSVSWWFRFGSLMSDGICGPVI